MAILHRGWTRVLQLSQTKRTLIANIFGNGWSALIQLLVIPIYISLLGEEAYGLYAFYLMIAGLIQVFDFGFSPTINRELARFTTRSEKATEVRTLVRTMEIIYLVLGVLLGISLAIVTPFLTNNWLQTTLNPSTVQQALLIMSLLVMVQWPLTFYQSGINGLQKQTQLNSLQVGISTLKHGGGVVVLLFVPNILALLSWLILVTTFQSLLTALLLWKNMPASNTHTLPHLNSLKPVRHFATGAALTAFAAIPLTMAAPILLSGSVPLDEYGYYTIATVYAGVITMLYMPVFTAIYPRLTALVETNSGDIVLNFFRFSGQFMSLVIVPIGFAMIIYSYELLFIWQRDASRANAIAPIAAIFVVVNILAGYSHLPYAIQLAHGVTKLNLVIAVLLGLVQLPLLYIFINIYGVLGAAIISLLIYFGMFLLNTVIADRKIMRFGLINWLSNNVVIPVTVTGAVFVFSSFLSSTSGTFLILVKVAISVILSICISALSMNLTRQWVTSKLRSGVGRL